MCDTFFFIFIFHRTFLIRTSKSCVGTYVLTMAAEGIIRNFQIQPVSVLCYAPFFSWHKLLSCVVNSRNNFGNNRSI